MAKAFAWLMESKMPDPRAVVVETSVGKLVFQPATLEILEAGWPKWKMTESKIPPPSSFWWSSLDCHLEWSHRESEKRHRALGSLDVEPIGAFWTRTMAYTSIPHELFRVKNSNLNATKPMDPISPAPNCCRVSPCLRVSTHLLSFHPFVYSHQKRGSQLPTHLPAVPRPRSPKLPHLQLPLVDQRGHLARFKMKPEAKTKKKTNKFWSTNNCPLIEKTGFDLNIL